MVDKPAAIDVLRQTEENKNELAFGVALSVTHNHTATAPSMLLTETLTAKPLTVKQHQQERHANLQSHRGNRMDVYYNGITDSENLYQTHTSVAAYTYKKLTALHCKHMIYKHCFFLERDL